MIDYLALPKFLYFSQFQRMPGRVPLENTLQRVRGNQKLEDEEKTFLDFCSFAGTTIDELASIQNYEKLKSKFEGASNKITQQIFRYWSQNKYLRVLFSRDPGEVGDAPPFNTGTVFNTRIWNELHMSSVPFDERSAGFVWFFSFLVMFSQVRRTHGDDLIILLDEPGLSLHAKAQADLLRFIDTELAPKHQVIYTTHSPFLVPPDKLTSVRTVEDVLVEVPGERPEVHGTKVSSDILKVSRDTLFPLQGALGYEITQSLFVGKNTLLVEGPSDVLYLNTMSTHLKEAGREALHVGWVMCPVGGIDKVAAFLALFNANMLNVCAFVDYAKGQKAKTADVKKLAEEVLKAGRLFLAHEYAGQDEADVEDLIGADGYLALVNEAYNLGPADRLVLPADGTRPPRIVKYVEEQLRLKPTVPQFDHYHPAEHLMMNRAGLVPKLPEHDKALDRFEAFFKDVNALVKA